MWLGTPWWVWVFVIPELALAALSLLALPFVGGFVLIEHWWDRRHQRSRLGRAAPGEPQRD